LPDFLQGVCPRRACTDHGDAGLRIIIVQSTPFTISVKSGSCAGCRPLICTAQCLEMFRQCRA
jgi:hypothetical protein